MHSSPLFMPPRAIATPAERRRILRCRRVGRALIYFFFFFRFPYLQQMKLDAPPMHAFMRHMTPRGDICAGHYARPGRSQAPRRIRRQGPAISPLISAYAADFALTADTAPGEAYAHRRSPHAALKMRFQDASPCFAIFRLRYCCA